VGNEKVDTSAAPSVAPIRPDPATVWLSDVMADVLPREIISEEVLAVDLLQ
jgi:hypothetical protein